MALLVPDTGEVKMLSYMLNVSSPSNVKYHLYTNNLTPAENTVLGDFTECADASYAAISVTGGSWTVGTVAGVTSASAATITFNISTTASIYGYYVTDSTSANLLWAERFAGAPLTYTSAGGTLYFDPYIALD